MTSLNGMLDDVIKDVEMEERSEFELGTMPMNKESQPQPQFRPGTGVDTQPGAGGGATTTQECGMKFEYKPPEDPLAACAAKLPQGPMEQCKQQCDNIRFREMMRCWELKQRVQNILRQSGCEPFPEPQPPQQTQQYGVLQMPQMPMNPYMPYMPQQPVIIPLPQQPQTNPGPGVGDVAMIDSPYNTFGDRPPTASRNRMMMPTCRNGRC